jgi:hypothetical protein|tara:strand:+ start:1550 stop:1951 length:402 start_codon:yes stop_codon:yes gene_type:complete
MKHYTKTYTAVKTGPKKYWIEHRFASGWDKLTEDSYYGTYEEAYQAIDDLLLDTKEAYEAGDMSEPYKAEEFRVSWDGDFFFYIRHIAPYVPPSNPLRKHVSNLRRGKDEELLAEQLLISDGWDLLKGVDPDD